MQRRGKVEIESNERQRKALEYLKELGLNDRQIKAIEYLKEYDEMDRKTYCTICKVEKTIAHKELSDLVEKNLIERRGKGRSSHYVLRTKRTISGRFKRIGFMLKNVVAKMNILMTISNPFTHDPYLYNDANRSPKVLNWINHCHFGNKNWQLC